jgi:glycosyltransferase involved in cell wall biosynthesis
VEAGLRPERVAVRAVTVRTALVHDWFQGYHGAERVVDALRTGLFPPASPPDIFTFHAARELLPGGLAAAIVKESRLAALPGIRQSGHDPGRWRYLLPYMPRFFSRLRLDEYDLVISSSHACAVNVRPRPGALHVCYCHTPMRYVWMPETEVGRAGGAKGVALRALRERLRRIDLEASARPDAYVANSEAVRDRIRRFYGRDAVVIHPPVDVGDFDPAAEKDPLHFVWASRLVAYKRPFVVAEAFRDLPYRLTMVGVGPLERKLRASLPPNVELRGWLPRDELARLYAESSGFVHVGEEDFGISMVEALASGTPVIALREGGARDIVRPNVDGVLIEDPEADAVRAAVEQLARSQWDRRLLAARARRFSRQAFVQSFGSLLEELLDAHESGHRSGR